MREFDVVTPPFAMSAADLWTLRMDLGWDEYFAELDGQTLALVSLDEGAESSCARVLELTYIKNPLPEWLQRTAGQEKLSFSLQQSFTKDAWDPAHPYGRSEALAAELVQQAYAIWAAGAAARAERPWTSLSNYAHNAQITVAYISVPLLILAELLWFLLACPCARFERRGRKRETVFRCTQKTLEALGHAVAARRRNNILRRHLIDSHAGAGHDQKGH